MQTLRLPRLDEFVAAWSSALAGISPALCGQHRKIIPAHA
jgi:hypothetical protein